MGLMRLIVHDRDRIPPGGLEHVHMCGQDDLPWFGRAYFSGDQLSSNAMKTTPAVCSFPGESASPAPCSSTLRRSSNATARTCWKSNSPAACSTTSATKSRSGRCLGWSSPNSCGQGAGSDCPNSPEPPRLQDDLAGRRRLGRAFAGHDHRPRWPDSPKSTFGKQSPCAARNRGSSLPGLASISAASRPKPTSLGTWPTRSTWCRCR